MTRRHDSSEDPIGHQALVKDEAGGIVMIPNGKKCLERRGCFGIAPGEKEHSVIGKEPFLS